jgi:hypothetical protein
LVPGHESTASATTPVLAARDSAEISRIKSELESLAANSELSGSWLAGAMEASWDMAEALLAHPQLADLLGERHRIIGHNWQHASAAQLVARYLRRAVAVMERVDFPPTALRRDLTGPRYAGLPVRGGRTDQPRRRPRRSNLGPHPGR